RPGFVGTDYLADGNTGKGAKSVTYTPGLATGTYKIFLNAPTGGSFATNVPVDIYTAGGVKVTVIVNEQLGGFILLGSFNLDSLSKVVIRTDGTTSTVIADAIKFVSA